MAVEGDKEALLDLLRLKHDEDGIGSFDRSKVMLSIERGTVRFRAMIGVVRGRIGIEASIGLFMGSPWDSSDDHLTDRWMFVHPDYRRSEHAKNLLIFAKRAAIELGFPLVMTTMLNETTANKAKLYERQLPRAGELFVYNPPVAQEQAIA